MSRCLSHNAKPTAESIHPGGAAVGLGVVIDFVYSLILWEDHRLLDVTAANLSINQP